MTLTVHLELTAFESIPSLLEHQHAPGGNPAARFSVIRALVAASQSDQRYRSTAQLMLILTLWPGLDGVYWRLARGFPDARADLAADILGQVGQAIFLLDITRVQAVTATLLRNVERDVRRRLIAARILGKAELPLHDPKVAVQAEAALAGEDGVMDLGDRLTGLSPEDTRLLERVFLFGETQEEAGRAHGLTPAASRKRYQRALTKLRSQQKSLRPLSHSGPPVGL